MARIIIAVGILLALAGGAWFVFSGGGMVDFDMGSISPRLIGDAAAIESDYVVPPMEGDYRNETYKFSLTMPEGFSTAELPNDDTGDAIVLQDAGGNGIQIYITPLDDDRKILTAADIRRDIPDMQVENVQEVEIGRDHRGVAFLSDNEAFGGASREVWFVFHGNLYQISTYTHLDPLLQAMFGTWKFF